MEQIEIMKIALKEAVVAFDKEEVPIGAVIVLDGKIISKAHNCTRTFKNPVKHAEIIAIEQAAKILNNERLTGCELYVTKEPCAMCAGAIVHARLRRVIIGASDDKYGACGTVLNICGNKKLNHRPEIEFGLLEKESRKLLMDFFKQKR